MTPEHEVRGYLAGGSRADGFPTDLYYQPTVVDGVTAEMALFREETFGPVAAVTTFREVDEAIALANDSELGLVAGVFTTDPRLARHVSERLQAGIVNVNDVPTYWQPHTPFGGWTGKRSGVGRLGGKYTIARDVTGQGDRLRHAPGVTRQAEDRAASVRSRATSTSRSPWAAETYQMPRRATQTPWSTSRSTSDR